MPASRRGYRIFISRSRVRSRSTASAVTRFNSVLRGGSDARPLRDEELDEAVVDLIGHVPLHVMPGIERLQRDDIAGVVAPDGGVLIGRRRAARPPEYQQRIGDFAA